MNSTEELNPRRRSSQKHASTTNPAQQGLADQGKSKLTSGIQRMMGAIRKSKGYSGDHRGQDQWKDTQRKKIADPDSAVLSDRQERGRPVTRLLYDSEKKIREVSQGKEVAGKEEE